MIKNFFKMKKNNNSKKKKISINEHAKILPKPKINYVNKFLCHKPNLLPQKYLAEKNAVASAFTQEEVKIKMVKIMGELIKKENGL